MDSIVPFFEESSQEMTNLEAKNKMSTTESSSDLRD